MLAWASKDGGEFAQMFNYLHWAWKVVYRAHLFRHLIMKATPQALQDSAIAHIAFLNMTKKITKISGQWYKLFCWFSTADSSSYKSYWQAVPGILKILLWDPVRLPLWSRHCCGWAKRTVMPSQPSGGTGSNASGLLLSLTQQLWGDSISNTQVVGGRREFLKVELMTQMILTNRWRCRPRQPSAMLQMTKRTKMGRSHLKRIFQFLLWTLCGKRETSKRPTRIKAGNAHAIIGSIL